MVAQDPNFCFLGSKHLDTHLKILVQKTIPQNVLHIEILKEKFNLKTANNRDSNDGHTAMKIGKFCLFHFILSTERFIKQAHFHFHFLQSFIYSN